MIYPPFSIPCRFVENRISPRLITIEKDGEEGGQKEMHRGCILIGKAVWQIRTNFSYQGGGL